LSFRILGGRGAVHDCPSGVQEVFQWVLSSIIFAGSASLVDTTDETQVWSSFRYIGSTTKANPSASPKTLLNHSIGSSDGQCGQRAGT
ncbi:hypothetical protein AVEN_46810-1, partial [Araneus ventricosus]